MHTYVHESAVGGEGGCTGFFVTSEVRRGFISHGDLKLVWEIWHKLQTHTITNSLLDTPSPRYLLCQSKLAPLGCALSPLRVLCQP